jgi:hypothetical protein
VALRQHFDPSPPKNAGMYEIIGVASDMGYFSSDVWDPERPMPFVPETQSTHFEEADLESREIWCDPNLVGLYGVTAYGAEQRSGELGVRMALGADWGNVVRMVLRAAFGKSGSGGGADSGGDGCRVGNRQSAVWSTALESIDAGACHAAAGTDGARGGGDSSPPGGSGRSDAGATQRVTHRTSFRPGMGLSTGLRPT